MVDIKDLLLKTNNRLLLKELQAEKISEVVSFFVKKSIKKTDFTIRNGVVFVKTKPIFKNEIFIKKDLILEEFLKHKETQNIKDLR